MQAVQKDVDALGPILDALWLFRRSATLLEEFGKPLRRVPHAQPEHPRARGREHESQGTATVVRRRPGGRRRVQRCARTGEAIGDSERPVARRGARRQRPSAAVREIQVVQAPHIAEADDAAMTRHGEADGDRGGARRDAALKTLASRRAAWVASATGRGRLPRWTASWPSTRRSSCCRAETAMSARWRSHSVRSGCSPRSARTTLRALQEALAKRAVRRHPIGYVATVQTVTSFHGPPSRPTS